MSLARSVTRAGLYSREKERKLDPGSDCAAGLGFLGCLLARIQLTRYLERGLPSEPKEKVDNDQHVTEQELWCQTPDSIGPAAAEHPLGS